MGGVGDGFPAGAPRTYRVTGSTLTFSPADGGGFKGLPPAMEHFDAAGIIPNWDQAKGKVRRTQFAAAQQWCGWHVVTASPPPPPQPTSSRFSFVPLPRLLL